MDAEDPTLQRLEDQIRRYDDKSVESQRRFAIGPGRTSPEDRGIEDVL